MEETCGRKRRGQGARHALRPTHARLVRHVKQIARLFTAPHNTTQTPATLRGMVNQILATQTAIWPEESESPAGQAHRGLARGWYAILALDSGSPAGTSRQGSRIVNSQSASCARRRPGRSSHCPSAVDNQALAGGQRGAGGEVKDGIGDVFRKRGAFHREMGGPFFELFGRHHRP